MARRYARSRFTNRKGALRSQASEIQVLSPTSMSAMGRRQLPPTRSQNATHTTLRAMALECALSAYGHGTDGRWWRRKTKGRRSSLKSLDKERSIRIHPAVGSE